MMRLYPDELLTHLQPLLDGASIFDNYSVHNDAVRCMFAIDSAWGYLSTGWKSQMESQQFWLSFDEAHLSEAQRLIIRLVFLYGMKKKPNDVVRTHTLDWDLARVVTVLRHIAGTVFRQADAP